MMYISNTNSMLICQGHSYWPFARVKVNKTLSLQFIFHFYPHKPTITDIILVTLQLLQIKMDKDLAPIGELCCLLTTLVFIYSQLSISQLGYLEFCETRIFYLNQKYILIAFPNVIWWQRLFYKSKLPEVELSCTSGNMNLYKIVPSTSRYRDLTVSEFEISRVDCICNGALRRHMGGLKVRVSLRVFLRTWFSYDFLQARKSKVLNITSLTSFALISRFRSGSGEMKCYRYFTMFCDI